MKVVETSDQVSCSRHCILDHIATVGIVAVLMFFPGCVSVTDTETPSQNDMKQAALRNKARLFKDPESVRDASIGYPHRILPGIYRTCLEANGRGEFGGYSGLTTYWFHYNPYTSQVSLGPTGLYDSCGQMTPFPELSGSRR